MATSVLGSRSAVRWQRRWLWLALPPCVALVAACGNEDRRSDEVDGGQRLDGGVDGGFGWFEPPLDLCGEGDCDVFTSEGCSEGEACKCVATRLNPTARGDYEARCLPPGFRSRSVQWRPRGAASRVCAWLGLHTSHHPLRGRMQAVLPRSGGAMRCRADLLADARFAVRWPVPRVRYAVGLPLL